MGRFSSGSSLDNPVDLPLAFSWDRTNRTLTLVIRNTGWRVNMNMRELEVAELFDAVNAIAGTSEDSLRRQETLNETLVETNRLLAKIADAVNVLADVTGNAELCRSCHLRIAGS